jgi:hypothetical protein
VYSWAVEYAQYKHAREVASVSDSTLFKMHECVSTVLLCRSGVTFKEVLMPQPPSTFLPGAYRYAAL